MSRPEKPINWVLVDNLLEAGCTGVEIATHFDMHPTTFYGKVEDQYKMSFTMYSSEKHQKGNSILRATQYAKAIGQSKKGDVTMLKWLGTNRLKQSESPIEINIDPNAMKSFNDIMEQLRELQALKTADTSNSAEHKSA